MTSLADRLMNSLRGRRTTRIPARRAAQASTESRSTDERSRDVRADGRPETGCSRQPIGSSTTKAFTASASTGCLNSPASLKGSLYYNFSGKDDLVRTYLQNRHARWAARIDEELPPPKRRRQDPRRLRRPSRPVRPTRLPRLRVPQRRRRSPPGSAEELATKDFRTWLHELFGDLVTAAGYATQTNSAAQLVMLYDGANISAPMDHNPAVAVAARDAAADLIETAARARAPRRRAPSRPTTT